MLNIVLIKLSQEKLGDAIKIFVVNWGVVGRGGGRNIKLNEY